MGHLVIHPRTFDFPKTDSNRADSLTKFLEAGNFARRNGDLIHSTKELWDISYSWGKLSEQLAYCSWQEIKNQPFWEWLPQTLHQTLSTFFYQNPSGKADHGSIEDFHLSFADDHSGIIGCRCDHVNNLDVSDIISWEWWKAGYYAKNKHNIRWPKDTDGFLPNTRFSNTLLSEVLRVHNKIEMVKDNKIGVAVHDEVIRHKGHNLQAFAVELGSTIALANYYILDEELSKAEALASGKPRKIFKSTGPDGKFIYLSIDHGHGMFEYHNHRGDHLGEYKFDGSHNSDAVASHNLKTL